MINIVFRADMIFCYIKHLAFVHINGASTDRWAVASHYYSLPGWIYYVWTAENMQ